MAVKYGVMTSAKRKRGCVRNIEREANRERKKYKNAVDLSKSKNNIYLKKSENWNRDIDRLLAENNIAEKSSSVVLVTTVYSFTPEWYKDNIEKLGKEKADEIMINYFKDCLAFEERNKGITISAVIHLDETTPHMHCASVPITEKAVTKAVPRLDENGNVKRYKNSERIVYDYVPVTDENGLEVKKTVLNASALFGNRIKMSKTQTDFYNECCEKYGLQRGKFSVYSDEKVKHLEEEDFKIKEQKKEIQAANVMLDNRIKLIEEEEEKERERLELLKKEIKEKENSLKTSKEKLEEINSKIESQNNILTSKINAINDKNNILAAQDFTFSKKEKELEEINSKIESQNNILTDLNDKVTELDNKVTDLNNKKTELDEINKEIESKNNILTTKKKEVIDKDAILFVKSCDLKDINNKIESQNNILTAKKDELDKIKDDIVSQDNILTAKKDAIDKKDKELKELEFKCNGLNIFIDNANEKIDTYIQNAEKVYNDFEADLNMTYIAFNNKISSFLDNLKEEVLDNEVEYCEGFRFVRTTIRELIKNHMEKAKEDKDSEIYFTTSDYIRKGIEESEKVDNSLKINKSSKEFNEKEFLNQLRLDINLEKEKNKDKDDYGPEF